MRVVVDPNVLISGAVATGVSGQLVDRWLTERPFEIVTCPALLAELGEVLRREKFRRWIDHDVVDRFVDLIEQESEPWPDPVEVPPVTGDPKDDYLVALFRDSAADWIVSGDPDLTSLSIEDVDVLTLASCYSDSERSLTGPWHSPRRHSPTRCTRWPPSSLGSRVRSTSSCKPLLATP